MVQKMAALQQMMTAMLMQMINMQKKKPNQCKRCMEKRLGKPYCT